MATAKLEPRRAWAYAALAPISFLCVVLGETDAAAQTATPHVEVVYPHDTAAFTEGARALRRKTLREHGIQRQVDVASRRSDDGRRREKHQSRSTLFGEGLTRIELAFRDPATFAMRREVTVSQNGSSIANLNELECVGSLVYVNQWKTDNVLRVDKVTGNVLTVIDASALLTADEKKNVDVLNGIAYDEAKRHFYLTGKYWPKLFEVSFDFDPGSAGDAGVSDAGRKDANGAMDAKGSSDTTRADASDGNPRDAVSSDAPSDATAPPIDASAPPDSGTGSGGAGEAAAIPATEIRTADARAGAAVRQHVHRARMRSRCSARFC